MHALYLEYLNVYKTMENKDNLKLHDYLWFLQNMDKFDDFTLQKKMKHQRKYQNYLKNINSYLESYIRRSRPLSSTDSLLTTINDSFEIKYAEGKIPGWDEEADNLNQEEWQYCSYC